MDFAQQLERENNEMRSTLRGYLALSSIDGKAERQPLHAYDEPPHLLQILG